MAGDSLFDEGSSGSAMYFLLRGRLHYRPGEDAPEYDWHENDERLLLMPGMWCAEVAVWTVWTHQGTMITGGAISYILCIKLNKWKDDLQRFSQSLSLMV